MNGDIKCISEPDKGTVFDFYINVICKTNDKGLLDKEHLKF